MIPLFKPYVNKDCTKDLKSVLNSGYIGEGPKVKEFERLLSDFLSGYVVLVNSCTSALHLAYHISEVDGGEVITTPMTCLATNTPIIQNNADIVWADVEPDTGNIDCKDVVKKINSNTRAIVCVHYGGNICNPELREIADKNGIPLIEDCAHLLHSGLRGLECYSFQAIKFLTTVDGGCLVTQDKEIYERAKLLRWYGINRESGQDMRCLDDISEIGYKFHMNDVNATIGISNLKDMRSISDKVRDNAVFYNKQFSSLKTIRPTRVSVDNDYWLYILLVDNRNEFMDYLKENGVACSLVHARNDIQRVFSYYMTRLDGLDEFWEKQVCIPVGWWVSKKDRNKIAKLVKAFDEKVCAS